MVDEARAFWIAVPGRGEIRTERLPSPAANDVVVRALYSGVSRGTEALVFNGRVPPGEYERMRAPFQIGQFPAPVKYGYSMVGRVERGPDDLVGRLVFALHPHQTAFVVPADAVHVLPTDLPPERGILLANLETAINGLWDARPHVGDRIAVVGAGTVGSLVAWLAAGIARCAVELVDINPRRASIARALGVAFATPDAASAGADVVVHASGSPAGLDIALRIAGFEATVVELSWYGDVQVPIALGEAFHVQRLTVKSSQVAHVAASQRSRWDRRRRMQLAVALVNDSTLDVLITGESDFEDLPHVMARLASGSTEEICHRIRYASR